MSNLMVFNNNEFGDVRVVERDGLPWFVGKDVAEVLGYSNPRDAISKHCKSAEVLTSQDATFEVPNRGLTIIPERDLYRLVMRSKLPSAERFEEWVVGEVLPSLRKTGSYSMDGYEVPKTYIEALEAHLASEKKALALQAKINEDKPKVTLAETIISSPDSILIGSLAKMLAGKGMEIGQKRLFAKLREEGYLCSKSGETKNMPTQKAIGMGLFEVIERTFKNTEGEEKIRFTTKVTPKGQMYFINRYVEDPLKMERQKAVEASQSKYAEMLPPSDEFEHEW